MERKTFDFQSFDLIRYFAYRFWPLTIITFTGAVAAIVISLLIDDKYKSTVTVFPSSNTSISKELLTERVTDENINQYGEDEAIERLLQVFKSDELKNKMIRKYKLMSHYDIDPQSEFARSKLYKRYDDNISAKKTHLTSLEIEVVDKNPKYAANIANDLVELLDSMVNAIEQRRARKGLKIVQKEYRKRKASFERTQDSLLQAGGGKQTGAPGKALMPFSLEHMPTIELWESEAEQLSLLKSRLSEARANAHYEMPRLMVVNPAYVPEKAKYPVRWAIVIGTAAGTFILSLLLFLGFDYMRHNYADLFSVCL